MRLIGIGYWLLAIGPAEGFGGGLEQEESGGCSGVLVIDAAFAEVTGSAATCHQRDG